MTHPHTIPYKTELTALERKGHAPVGQPKKRNIKYPTNAPPRAQSKNSTVFLTNSPPLYYYKLYIYIMQYHKNYDIIKKSEVFL